MTATDDDVITSWRDRVGTLRKRGRVSAAALTVVPAGEIDVRLGRPPASERLSDEERELWERLTFSRRPGWFSGAESLLESYVTAAIYCRRLEATLRKAKPGTSDRYQRLARLHRHRSLWRPRWRRGYGSRRPRSLTKANRRTATCRWPDKEKAPARARRGPFKLKSIAACRTIAQCLNLEHEIHDTASKLCILGFEPLK